MQINAIKKLHCGLFHAPLSEVKRLMPEVWPIIQKAPMVQGEKYVVDVKVHMLMPGQWPCIPNWHVDNVPRDKNLKQQWHKRDPEKKMLLWVSGEPLTEFRDRGFMAKVPAQKWIEFTQFDEHRGTMSKEHTWRIFMRLTPEPLLFPGKRHEWLRRHAQVYLDANTFKW